MGSTSKQSVVFGLWLVGLSAVVALLWHEDRFFATVGVPIATISEAQRDVTYRGEDDIRWKALGGAGQGVFDGDKLATGPKSRAIIDFGDGRAASVGPNTQMVVSSIRQESGLTYIINLSKGSVAIQKNAVKNRQAKSVFPVIIRSGGRDYLVEPGEERGVARDEKGVKEFVGRKPPPRASKSDVEQTPSSLAPKISVPTTVVASLIQQTPIAIVGSTPIPGEPVLEASPPPTAVPIENVQVVEAPREDVATSLIPKKLPAKPAQPKMPKVPIDPVVPPAKAIGTEIELDLSGLEREYYSFESLKRIRGEIGALKWREPAVGSSSLQWSPAVELKQGGNRKEVALPRTGSTVLKLEDFGDLQEIEKKNGIPCSLLELRGGAKVSEQGKKPVWSFAGETRQISICSYKDAIAALPLVVGVSRLEAGKVRRPQLFKKPVASDLKFQMIVTTPSQFQSLLPLLAGSENFRVATSKGLAPSGIFVTKAGKVVMQVAGAGFTSASAEKIREKISGDLVFKGSRDALYDGSKLSADKLREMISRSDAQGKKIYFHKSGNLVAVSRGFLEERQEVAAFIQAISSQMFTEKVTIVSYK